MTDDDDASPTLTVGARTLPQTIEPLPPPPRADPPAATAASDLGARYDLKQVIGRGGMGEVRLARDARIDRDVAVKLMHAGQRDDTTVARFFREARVQGGLEHPAVVPVHDLGIDLDGNPYFVMKRLAGTTLHDVLSRHLVTDEDHGRQTPMPGRMRWSRRQLLARLVDVCLAIEFAHTRGVVHRDIKPANIMLGDFGEAYVLDWGLARIVGAAGREVAFRAVQPLSGESAGATVAGDLLGTPGFMSPEQARGEEVDARTDVFALGCILFEILTDEPALPTGLAALQDTLDLTYLRPSERAPSTEIAPELDDICARATAADREARPSARALADRIQAYLDGDRDLAQRRELAAEHARRAQAALESTTLGGLEPDQTDAARATAMREGGRALALDPNNMTAQLVLGGLLLERPGTEIPAGALADAELERAKMRQQITKYAATGYLGMMLITPTLFLFDTHAIWPIVTLMAVAGGAALAAFLGSRTVVDLRTPWFPVVLGLTLAMLGLVGIIFGPLFLLPMFITGSLAAWLIQPLPYPPWLLTLAHALTILPILTLEWLEVLPATFHIANNQLVLQPWVLDLTPAMTVVVFVIALGTQTASTLNIMVSMKHTQLNAQNRVHAQSWHLKQLLPRSADAPAPADARSPRSARDSPRAPASRRA